MMNYNIFTKEVVEVVQQNLLNLLNSDIDFQNKYIVSNPRAVGDAVQEMLGENLIKCFPDNLVRVCNETFARKSLADVAFYDNENNYYAVDIKTHNKNTRFNMPNLTSVERLPKFYESDSNFFVILFVEYSTIDGKIVFDNVYFAPIEHFSWNCLRIGALGVGQIQIVNANVINIDTTQNRKQWMLQFCDRLNIFYPKEIAKIEKRIAKVEKVRNFWRTK